MLAGQVALVTGAARGLGAAIARRLAECGARVILADRDDADPAAAAIRQGGGVAEAARLDVTEDADWTRCVTAATARHGRLDVLVSNAGIIGRRTIAEMDTALWQQVIAVNLSGAFLGIRAVAPAMRAGGGGAIVVIGSTAGLATHADPAYAASKWGLRGLVRSAALELAPWGIRVNCLHPATIATDMAADGLPGHLAANRAAIPLGREAAPEEVARVAAFLASPEASFMTGADVPVDGGYTGAGLAHLRDRLRERIASRDD